MNISHIASRQEWLTARLDLLAKENAASRQLPALAEQRRAFPAVPALGRQRYINELPWHDTYGASGRHAHHH
jgi:predicted dithiol-disulfide oxidoreductase (DUF899 family)